MNTVVLSAFLGHPSFSFFSFFFLVFESVGSGGVDAEAVFVSGVLCLWYSGLELLWVSLHFSRCILVWERQGEMGSGGDGERMRVDLEGDGLQSKNIQGDVSVLFLIIFVYIFFFLILYVFMYGSLHELMKGNSGRLVLMAEISYFVIFISFKKIFQWKCLA